MSTSKFRWLIFVLGVSTFAAGAVGLWSTSPRALAAGAGDSRLQTLLKERLVILEDSASQMTKLYQSGQTSLAKVWEANQAVSHAKFDMCETDRERMVVLETLLAAARDYEKRVSEHVKSGEMPSSEVLKARLNRLECEIALERIKGK